MNERTKPNFSSNFFFSFYFCYCAALTSGVRVAENESRREEKNTFRRKQVQTLNHLISNILRNESLINRFLIDREDMSQNDLLSKKQRGEVNEIVFIYFGGVVSYWLRRDLLNPGSLIRTEWISVCERGISFCLNGAQQELIGNGDASDRLKLIASKHFLVNKISKFISSIDIEITHFSKCCSISFQPPPPGCKSQNPNPIMILLMASLEEPTKCSIAVISFRIFIDPFGIHIAHTLTDEIDSAHAFLYVRCIWFGIFGVCSSRSLSHSFPTRARCSECNWMLYSQLWMRIAGVVATGSNENAYFIKCVWEIKFSAVGILLDFFVWQDLLGALMSTVAKDFDSVCSP